MAAPDPYRYFRIEAGEILDGIGKDLLELERGNAVDQVVGRLLRLAHTLKGAARVVRQKDIADLAHAMEDALEPLRGGAGAVSRELIDALLGLSDAMAAKVGALAVPAGSGAEPVAVPVTAKADREEPVSMLRVDKKELQALGDGVAEVSSEVAGLRRALGSLESARKLAEVLQQRLRFRGGDAGGLSGARLGATAEELVQRLAAMGREVTQGLERLDREVRQVAETTERVGLVPAALMFTALERAARDAGVSLGKKVEVEATGGDVRLDPNVVTMVQGALVQAVRNAVAHGLEPESDRRRGGKANAGRIAIRVVREGNRVHFSCRDDGRGVDFGAVRDAAVRRGVAGAAELDEKGLSELLLAGGISTSSEVTAVSGRGVGLDVVREAAVRLGGEATLSSQAGRGVLVELSVPLSRSAVDALIVETGGQVAAIPLDCVRRTLRVAPGDVTRSAEGDSIVHEGKVIPFAPLARSLRVAGGAASGRRTWSAVVLESRGVTAAVGVDRLLGTETVIARPVPEGMPPHVAVAGVTLDANGNPRQVLDPEGLVSGAAGAEREEAAEAPRRAPILVIDDSLTTRMLEQSILESAGYEVELAVSAEDGLEKARARRYSLFLVDVEMPGMDGFTFVERTRADPVLRETPAILVTSRGSDDDKRRGATAGASAYVVKGEFNQTELLRRIAALVG